MSERTTLAEQSRFVQRRKAPSTTNFVAQTGHSVGETTSFVEGIDSVNGSPSEWLLPSISTAFAGPILSMIFGMTSPRLTIRTLSPIRIPSLSTSPALCRVVFSTVTPETLTGATRATGVTAPVLPVCHSTPISTVVASSGGNFQANAHLGWCAVVPSNLRFSKSSSLKTTPSTSHSRESRLAA